MAPKVSNFNIWEKDGKFCGPIFFSNFLHYPLVAGHANHNPSSKGFLNKFTIQKHLHLEIWNAVDYYMCPTCVPLTILFPLEFVFFFLSIVQKYDSVRLWVCVLYFFFHLIIELGWKLNSHENTFLWVFKKLTT